MRDKQTLGDLLRADAVDCGCERGFEVIDEYVDIEVAGGDAAAQFPGLAAHLESCSACRLDHDAILDAALTEG